MAFESIIKHAKPLMRQMLESVYSYNSRFLLNEQQEKQLEKILFSMLVIDRKFFYQGENAYDDTALAIGEGQTISQPSTIARMLILADLYEGDDVLEIGTGSGYNASLIAFLACPGNVVSVERFLSLKEKAETNLRNLRNHLKQTNPEIFEKLSKINFYAENIFEKGKAYKKKYAKIIITAGIENGEEKKIENLAKELLKQKGILLCPYQSGPLLIFKKKGKEIIISKTKEEYVFVPLLEK